MWGTYMPSSLPTMALSTELFPSLSWCPGQGLAYAPAEFYGAPVYPFLQPTWEKHAWPQALIICKFDEGALHCLLQAIDDVE